MKNQKQEVGDLQFWKECIVTYRNKGNAAKSLKKKIDYAKCLCECRHWLKYAESKILIAILFVILFCSSCQTMKGAMGDTAWLLKTGSDNIKVQEK